MENQHRRIAGYRELAKDDIDLMNKVKLHEQVTLELVKEVQARVRELRHAAAQTQDEAEADRLNGAEPERWAAIARTDFQTGFMALVRSVAQPGAPK